MEMFRNRSSFLLTQFREFYRELVRLRRSIAYAGTARGASFAPAEGRGSVLSIWQPLVSLLERQALEAGEMGGSFAFEIYREAQYVMCALADEIFLHEDWDGRENWQLLEGRLFETHYAGEEVFNRIDGCCSGTIPFTSIWHRFTFRPCPSASRVNIAGRKATSPRFTGNSSSR